MIRTEDLIETLRSCARLARAKTVERFAAMPCDARTRRKLDREIAAVLDAFDDAVARKVAELRAGTGGRA
jgi:hypothetical protein